MDVQSPVISAPAMPRQAGKTLCEKGVRKSPSVQGLQNWRKPCTPIIVNYLIISYLQKERVQGLRHSSRPCAPEVIFGVRKCPLSRSSRYSCNSDMRYVLAASGFGIRCPGPNNPILIRIPKYIIFSNLRSIHYLYKTNEEILFLGNSGSSRPDCLCRFVVRREA